MFDCHAEVGHYNQEHPRGTKFQSKELKMQRERLFKFIEEGGPTVFDAIEMQVIPLKNLSFEQLEQPVAFPSVNLEHDAKVARYCKYIYKADQLMRESNFKDAIKLYKSAFSHAESDESLDDYASGGNYYYKKILLWQCYLEVSEREGIHECLRNAFNMGMDENEILKMFQRQNSYTTTLRCDHYFYLLLQEKLFLFDEEYRKRGSVDNRLQRIKNLMDLIEDPFCPQKGEQLVQRAKGIERQIQDRIPILIPGKHYMRS